MSIFGIITICAAIALLLLGVSGGLIYGAFDDFFDEYEKQTKTFIITAICLGVFFIASIFVGIGINTEDERVFVQRYLAQKETIEASLEQEEMGGLERLELVKQASTLNGNVAERKARFELWHYVFYDNTIYDGVELIDLNKKGE